MAKAVRWLQSHSKATKQSVNSDYSESAFAVTSVCLEGYRRAIFVSDMLQGRTALMHACIQGNTELTAVLLDHGADLLAKDNQVCLFPHCHAHLQTVSSTSAADESN